MSNDVDQKFQIETSEKLGKVIATLERVETQTTMTNGRVTKLELINAATVAEAAIKAAEILAQKRKRDLIITIVWSIVGALIGAAAVWFKTGG